MPPRKRTTPTRTRKAPVKKAPEKKVCGHINRHVFDVKLVCERKLGHLGDHYAAKDADGNEVVNGYWNDAAGY